MRYKLFGASGMRVSELCLGCMTFGDAWEYGADRSESRRIFEAFAAAGGNFLDTANLYTGGQSERFLGEFIARDRDRFIVATKYGLATRGDDPNAAGLHRKYLEPSGGGRRAAAGQAALAWVRQRSRAGLIPVIGARTAEQLAENLRCREISLSTDQLARLEAASSIDLGFPHEFLRKPAIQAKLHGDLGDRIDGERD